MMRPVLLERFGDGSGYAYNPEDPSGIKYLTKRMFELYSGLLCSHNPPVVNLRSNPEYTLFVKHGLARTSDKTYGADGKEAKTLTVWFHVSNACNLSCGYCYIPRLVKAVDTRDMTEFFMKSDTAKSAAEKLFSFCEQLGFRRLQIKFAGGEPTLNPQLIENVCKYAQELSRTSGVKVSFRILTNGVFEDNRVLNILKDYQFGVSISVDGDKESHDQVRFTVNRTTNSANEIVRRGTWQTISDTIDTLLAIDIKPYLLCTITGKNYSRIFNLIQFCVNRGIGFRLSPVRNNAPQIAVELQEKILTELRRIYNWLGENLPVSMPLDRFARFAEWNLRVKKQTVCGTCKNTLSIDHEGRVASCQMRMDKPFGTLRDNDLGVIFENMRNSDFNRYLVHPETKTENCPACYWRYTCAGGCPEHTRNALGTVNSPSPWCYLYMNLLPTYIRAIALQIKRAIDTKQSEETAKSVVEGNQMLLAKTILN